MRVEFWKMERNGRVHCGWDAHLGKRRHVPGAFMSVGRTIPHDLAQLVIEAAAHLDDGFWGLIERGATFKSTGRRRTRPGRAVIAENRQALRRSEAIVGHHYAAWLAGEDTAVARLVEAAAGQWRGLRPEDRLVFEWPAPTGQVLQGRVRA